ncbi:acyltransferase family protein [Mesorhizobium sp. NBSH29]|uniref:acyltransferase family protein n=1 Tax=Mesorhizobium sp. NBSH29 TaxID=2654249 RepID=UPI001896895D|nr:acyltransferase family protein [Mesorhizobium sp. NBSH29]QPC86304.1 acyltransferase family protein [Mesorhizobium sp. NBSH29]
MQSSGRLHYVDALRVGAFLFLILYHSSVAFFPDLTWLIQSSDTSALLSEIMKFPRAWRLALLFFVSGMGTYFAFRSHSSVQFLYERLARLFIPLIFAMCVIVVPQVWYERMYEDGYHGSLGAFWLTRYFTEGKYPTGNFTWAHMWFVGYLLVMTVLCYPLFQVLLQPRFRRVGEAFEATARSAGIYLLFLLPLALNLALSPLFPRQTNALYNDGAWFAAWTAWFGLGFLVAKHHRAVIGSIVEQRWTSTVLALLLTVVLYHYSWRIGTAHPIGDYENMTVLYKTLLFALAWSMILTLVGFAARHLDRSNATVTWLNRKIFPLYIVHQTIIVAALFYILPMEGSVGAKYGAVLTMTLVGSLAFSIAAEWLPWPLRALTGLPEKPVPAPVSDVSAGGLATRSG